MCSVLLKNYWLNRIERRKKDQAKTARLNGIVDDVVRRVKLARDSKDKKKTN